MSEGSTTPDLVELTRRMFEAVNSGELEAASFYAPEGDRLIARTTVHADVHEARAAAERPAAERV
jgi:hypothetical protein